MLESKIQLSIRKYLKKNGWLVIKIILAGKKMAIFYYFKKEWEILKTVFGDGLTNDLDEFNNSGKHIALQQVSGSEGISLKAADVLVIYNWGYSGRHATQMTDRLTTIDRTENNVYFVLSKGGLNEKIYRAVKEKKKYNQRIFKKDYEGVVNPVIYKKLAKV